MRELTLDKLPKNILAKLDLETVFKASRCVIAAERLQIFRRLYVRELSAADIARHTGIHGIHCESFLDYLVLLGLLKKIKNLYSNSSLANRHFIRGRSIEWTRHCSAECAKDFEAFTVLEDAISSGQDWRRILGKRRKPDYQLLQEDSEWARGFTYALYDLNKPTAETLANNLDLSHYRSLLDVGGGSGVMSMALVRAHPNLRACVLDLKFVCDATRQIIRKERMSRRVKAVVGDMNKSIPSGFDVIMFWDIGRIDDRVMKMAYQSLPENGLVVRSCRPPRRSGKPLSRFLSEYLSVRPEGQTRIDKINSLKTAGFTSVRYRRISRSIGLITGFKGRVRNNMI
jgi:hypothetical protein